MKISIKILIFGHKNNENRSHHTNFTGCLYNYKVIMFEILVPSCKTLNGLVKKYLSDLITSHQLNRCLHSNTNDSLQLYRPVFRTKNYGGHAFLSCTPVLLNNLLLDMRSIC